MAMRGKKKEAERKKKRQSEKNGTEAKKKLRYLQTKIPAKNHAKITVGGNQAK